LLTVDKYSVLFSETHHVISWFSLKFPKSEPGQLQKKDATAWKITKDII